MSTLFYSIQIDSILKDELNEIFKIRSDDRSKFWIYNVDFDSYFKKYKKNNILEYLISLLENNIKNIAKLGIVSSDITVWIVYEYDDQCNFEFIPNDMKRLGQLNISLCVSCYQYDKNQDNWDIIRI